MDLSKAIVEIRIDKKQICEDLEIPLDISVYELLTALNSIYHLDLDLDDMSRCFIKTESPISIMKGNRLLGEYGIHNGTVINITE